MEKAPANKKEMNPRTKEGQGLDYWASGLYVNGIITKEAYDYFTYVNSHKEREIEKRGLPQLKHYGFFDSIKSLSDFLKIQDDNQRFIIRCSNNSGDVKRLLDSTKSEVVEFAKKLPGGFNSWKVELKEFTDTKEAGTLIIDSRGNVIMESWQGPHLHVSLNSPKILCRYDVDDIFPKYKWYIPEEIDDKTAILMQDRMIGVIKRFIPNMRPHTGDQLYLEYGFKPDNTFYAIEANDSTVLTDKVTDLSENIKNDEENYKNTSKK